MENKACLVSCFKCDRPVERVFEGQMQPSDGTRFSTFGHYGSTFWDSFHGEEISLIVCDECLKSHTERIVRQKRYVEILVTDYSVNSHPTVTVGRHWIDREPVPYFDGPEDNTKSVEIDPEQIGDEKVDGCHVEWRQDWRTLREHLIAAAEKWDEDH